MILSGCSKASDKAGDAGQAAQPPADKTEKQAEVKKDPIELTLYSHNILLPDEFFQTVFAEPVKKKFPNITLKLHLFNGGKTQSLDDMIAAGEMPDIIYANQNIGLDFDERLHAVEDLAPYIKKNNFDVNKLEPSIMKAIKDYGPTGKIIALPHAMSFYALYYNKDLFDKFGAPYPKDGISWQETIDLGRKLTRVDNGIQYSGLILRVIESYAINAPVIDAKTFKPLLNTEPWRKLFSTMKQVYDIPGNEYDPKTFSNFNDWFMKDQTAAMFPANNLLDRLILSEKDLGMKWDVTTFPQTPEAPNLYPHVNGNSLLMSSQTKHKDDVFAVIQYLLSPEAQTILIKEGRMSGLADPEVRKHYGENMPELKGKNIQAIFKSSPAPIPPETPYNGLSTKIIRDSFVNYISGKEDLNSALRSADEAFDKAVKEAQSK
jgi:multiple sugar transport system substrate-binding protein